MKDIRRRIRWFWQRPTRGFDDVELWNLSSHLAAYIYPRIKAFADMGQAGHPSTITAERWQDILGEMVFAFEYLAKEDELPWNAEADARCRKGLRLFGKWFGHLWD